jgi:hypothetical protein
MKENKAGNHAQYGYARLDQRALLHTEEPISEQVTFGLRPRPQKWTGSMIVPSKNSRRHANSTHLEPAQTFTELLAELHVHLPLTYNIFSKFLSCETTLGEAHLLLGTPFRGFLDACCYHLVGSLAQGLNSVDGRVQSFAQGAL